MTTHEIASLVEFSEAKAYESMVQGMPRQFSKEQGIRAVSINSAVAIIAKSITTSLNLNRVIGLGISKPATENLIDEIVQLYAADNLPFGIEVGPFSGPDHIGDWLRQRRIRRGVSTALHYRRAEAVSIATKHISSVQAQSDERHIVADICCSVFHMPGVVHEIIANTADIPGWRQWLVWIDGQPAAASLSFIGDSIGWLGWDATLPAFRGRGAQLALIAARVNDAVASGCRFVTCETAVNTSARNDPSYENYARSGFSFAYERATYISVLRENRR